MAISLYEPGIRKSAYAEEPLRGDTMKLYHTGTVTIRVPDIHIGRKTADFGQGFYLTPDKDFAYRWAGRDAVVNEYELNLTGLCVHTFQRNDEWFHYLFQNRRGSDQLKADVVIGPIANDTIFDTMGIISSGFLEPAEALKLLMIGPAYTQVVIKTQKAAAQLRWLHSENIPPLHNDVRKAEQEAYARLFALAMQEMDQDP